MAGFLSDSQKNEVRAIVDKIHETFAREIIVYKKGQKISVSTSSGYNSIYKANPTASKENIIASKDAIGRAMINPASFGYCPDSQLAKDITVAANKTLIKNTII